MENQAITKGIKWRRSLLERELEWFIPPNGCVCESIDLERIHQIKEELFRLHLLLIILEANE